MRNRAENGARPSVGAPGQARRESHLAGGYSREDCTTLTSSTQAAGIEKFLLPGKENALPGRTLAGLLGLHSLRDVSAAIEGARRAGAPICASTDAKCPGYYMATSAGELAAYIASLDRRLSNVRQTRQYLEDTLTQMTAQERMEGI